MLRLDVRLLDRLLDRRHLFAKGIALLVGAAVLWVGAGTSLDRLLRSGRDAIRTHPASGQIHIVEMDARSLRALDQWPWPRRYHAQLIDRLRSAGVRSIAFDVNFSAVSNPVDDGAMAAALQRAGGSVILPTLRQQESAGSSEFVDSLPAIPFRDHAFFAAVTVHPDEDSYVRQMPLGIETFGVARPSLASLVAEQQAEIGRAFEIDYAIDPATIPRHSFVDVISGRVPAAALAGRRIIVGATAVDLGDRYGVPRHGIIPGVVIQALAAETLLNGRIPAATNGFIPLLLALGLIAAAIRRRGSRRTRAAAFAGGSLAVLALPLATEHLFALSMPLAPALAALAAAAAASLSLYFAERFRNRARTDEATGLPNLAALEAAAGQAEAAIVVVARIERFAATAAGLGPAATVNLIHRVADRLSFGQSATIYRTDEGSLAWLEPASGAAALDERLEALSALMRSPVDCGRLVDVTLSFGIADATDAGAKQQVANAALAAEHAARRGVRRERFSQAGEEVNWHLSLLGELDAAMADGEVWNAYQPKLDIASGRILGVEALVRWQHRERGAIGPDAFIPLVEKHGRARDLTLHVFDQALSDLRSWREQGHELTVAVNVSATLLADPGFVPLIRDRLEAAALPPGSITIEVTESAAMQEPEVAIAALEEWRALGLLISVDDYGTGQSSLGYLQKLPATELKIDKSFVARIANDQRDAIMVRSTIALAHELRIKVVAEGVEDEACLSLLTSMGCDTAQGWLIGRPMPADAITAFLVDRMSAAA